ncbi:MAG: DUF6391 domain-containing protein [Oscillatoriaceae cyanobacterium]
MTNSSPFDFTPHPTQDADLLTQLEFLPGLKEILMLRQVHALEHATVWVLSASYPGESFTGSSSRRNQDNEGLGGMSTAEGFYLYGRVNSQNLLRSVRIAKERLTSGEWDLAVHPRCGTNLSVGVLLTAGFAFGMSFLLPKGPIEQAIGLGIATAAAATVAPDLGSLAQRYLTTAIPFNLEVEEVTVTQDLWGRPAHFVRVRWRQD